MWISDPSRVLLHHEHGVIVSGDVLPMAHITAMEADCRTRDSTVYAAPLQQQPYTRIEAPSGGCVNAALRPPNWRRHAGWLSEELPGPLLYRHVKPEWYRRPSSLPVIPGGMLR